MVSRKRSLVLGGLVAVAGTLCTILAGPSAQRGIPVLSLRVGQSFIQVVRDSSYPVLAHTGDPRQREDGFGWTDITDPVILRFNDGKHGFKLPPTKFVAMTYQDAKLATVATTPMLEKLPFDRAVAVLENLQDQFKAGGWEPWRDDGSAWFDFTPEGKKRLYAQMFEPQYMQSISLRVPKKYGMTFRLWCAEGCATRQPPYLFLIDLGVGSDTASLSAPPAPPASPAPKPPAPAPPP
jgi:hypothetical protein